MSLTKLNENLNVHQSLPDKPNLNSEELKQKFDEASNTIKAYINETLTEEIDTQLSQGLINTDTKVGNMRQEINQQLVQDESQIQTNKTNIDNLIEKTSDSGWIITDNMGLDFKEYNNTESNKPKFRKNGNIIEIWGVVTPTKEFSSETETVYTIFTLPENYRPSMVRRYLMQGTGNNYWLLTINTDGTVTHSRYRKDASEYHASPGNWLPFNAMFFI